MIAETTGFPTKYAKIVVTDNQGRYVMPDLPKARYRVWVRGFVCQPKPFTSIWSPPSLATTLGQVANSATRVHHWAYTSSVLPA